MNTFTVQVYIRLPPGHALDFLRFRLEPEYCLDEFKTIFRGVKGAYASIQTEGEKDIAGNCSNYCWIVAPAQDSEAWNTNLW